LNNYGFERNILVLFYGVISTDKSEYVRERLN